MTKLFFIKDIKKSGTSCSSFEGNKKYIATADIQNSEIVNYEIVDYKNKPSRANLIAPEDSVLFAKMQGTNKVIRLNNETKNNIYSTGFYAFKDERILPDYLKHYLSSRFFNDIKDKNCQGATMKAINDDGLSKISINVPELEEQQEIVKKLNVLTSLIDKNKQLIENYSQLVKSQFIEMFGDPFINNKNWKTQYLSELGTLKNGMNFDSSKTGIKIKCLGVGDFKDFAIIDNISSLSDIYLKTNPNKEYLLENEDIVFVRSNGNKNLVGRSVAIYPNNSPVTFSGFCIRFRQNSNILATPYLLSVLKCESVKQALIGRGANIQNLNQKMLSNLLIPIPPIELQNKFADFVKHIDKLKLNDMLMEVA